jgi:hypothetical protein
MGRNSAAAATVEDFPQQIDADAFPEPQEAPHAADVLRKRRR